MNRCKPTTKRNRLIAAVAICLAATPCLAEYTVRIPTSTLGGTGSTGSQTQGGGGGGGAAPGDGSVWESWAAGNGFDLSSDYSSLTASPGSSTTDFPSENYPAADIETIEFTKGSIGALDRLASVKSLTGTLRMETPNTTSLAGLDNITSVGGGLELKDFAITDLQGLGSLQSVGGTFDLHDLASLTSLSGIESLNSVGAFDLDNTATSSIAAFSGTSISGTGSYTGQVWIKNNPNLTSLDGLEGVTSPRWIGISETPISDLSALSGVTEFRSKGDQYLESEGYSFYVFQADVEEVQTLDFFSSLTSTAGVIDLTDFPQLKDVTGLSNLSFDPSNADSKVEFSSMVGQYWPEPITKMSASSDFCQSARSLGNRVNISIDKVCETP